MMAARAVARISGIILLGFGLSACGDSSDPAQDASFSGIYQVASHTRSLGDCEKEGSPFVGDAFFKLAQEDGKLRYHRCDSAEHCQGADPGREFSRRLDSGWIGTQADATKLRGACSAQLGERVVSRLNGDNIQIEVRQFSGEFSREDGQACDAELVELNRARLTCIQRDIIKATPLAEP